MDRAIQLEHLAEAERHIAEGKARIVKQRAIIADLERDGHDTTQAYALLRTFLKTQAGHEEHRKSILDELAK